MLPESLNQLQFTKHNKIRCHKLARVLRRGARRGLKFQRDSKYFCMEDILSISQGAPQTEPYTTIYILKLYLSFMSCHKNVEKFWGKFSGFFPKNFQDFLCIQCFNINRVPGPRIGKISWPKPEFNKNVKM